MGSELENGAKLSSRNRFWEQIGVPHQLFRSKNFAVCNATYVFKMFAESYVRIAFLSSKH